MRRTRARATITAVLATAAALLAISATPAAAQAPVGIFAANSENNATIEMLVIGPANSTVAVSEEIGANRTLVKSVALGPAVGGTESNFALLEEHSPIPANSVRIPALCWSPHP